MSEAKALAQDEKNERRLAKKAFKKQEKKEHKQQLRLAHRVERYTLLKTTAIIFFFLSLLFLVQFILTKYCNYYFNFGDDSVNYKDINWMQPFEKWNWEIRNDFKYVEVVTQSTIPGVTVSGKVLIIKDLFWDGTNQTMAVTREALVINNFANILLYIFFTTTFAIGVILLLCYFLVGRRKIREVIEEYTEYKVALSQKGNTTTPTTNVQPMIAQPVMFKETIILRDSEKAAPLPEQPITAPVVEPEPEPFFEPEPEPFEPEPILFEDGDTVPFIVPKAPKKKRKKYPSVGKKDLVAEMYDVLKGSLTLRELNRIYDLTFETIVEELMKSQENEIMIPNFGKFAKVTILAHEGINPSTGEKVWIETKHKVKFTPSITLKRLMEETTKK